MRYDLIPSRFLLPSFWEDEEEFLPVTATPSGISIYEDDKNVYVEAAVPGIDPKNIEVTFDKGYLWIKGESKEEEKDTKKKYYRKAERSVSYRVAVPGEIDTAAEPEATYKHGVMTVAFPKSPKSQPKSIKVKEK
jgi:HSP20 family protein